MKDLIIFTILIVFSIFFGIAVLKTTIKKEKNTEYRLIEKIDPDYDRKYPKSF